MKSTDFIVARHHLHDCKFIEAQLPDANALADETLLIKVDRFAFTANNITYAALGDQLKYWQLFPAPENFGIIPVWGLGEVIASRHPLIETGERLFGYFPMATHLVIEAAGVSSAACAMLPRIGKASRRYTMLTRASAATRLSPVTAATIRHCCGRCSCCRFSSTIFSTRTIFSALAPCCSPALPARRRSGLGILQARPDPIRVIGLTSAANADFVRSLGCYDEIVTYDRVTSLPADSPVAFVDMAGNSELRAKLHRHFGEQMKYSAQIGLTHRSLLPDEPELPGARPIWFFAPDQIRKRAKEWGPGGIDQRFGTAWSDFAPTVANRLVVVESRGLAAVKQVYLDTLNGHIRPEQGHILSLLD